MIDRLNNLEHIPGFLTVLGKITGGDRLIHLSGLVGSSRSLLASWLYQKLSRTILFISPDQESTEKASTDFKAFLGDSSVDLYPSWEIQPYEIRAPHAENIGDRLKILHDIINGFAKVICVDRKSVV